MKDDAPQLPPDPDLQLQRDIYYLAADALRGMLPPPPTDTAEDRARRNHVAIATVAAMVPANPAEVRLAAHHVAAIAHADDALRQAAQQAADPGRVAQLRAQAASMGREARGYLGSLLRVQAARQKREANDDSRESAAWTERSVLGLMTEALERLPPVVPAPVAVASAAPAAASSPPQQAPILDYDDWPEEEKRLDRLRAKASRYAILHTMRVKEIRRLGRLPDNCDYEPPEPEVLQEIITGNHSNLRWADTYEPYVAPSP